MKRALLCLVGWWLGLSAAPAWSAEPEAPPRRPLEELLPAQSAPGDPACDGYCPGLIDRDPFTAGSCSLQFMAGRYNKTSAGPGGPPFDYAPFAGRFGCMLTTPSCDGCWYRGNIEALLEASYGSVIREFGHYVSGANAILRYNFVQPDCMVVPYIQGGGGFVLTDAWQWPSPYQRLIGAEFEFLLRGEVGARVMILENLSLDCEVGFQHISNACLATRNAGVNNIGGTIGFTYFFGRLSRFPWEKRNACLPPE